MNRSFVGALVIVAAAPLLFAGGSKRPERAIPWAESLDAAFEEAAERNVPLLISLGKDH